MVQVAVLRLTDSAKQFYNGCLELHSAGMTWQRFKSVFRDRFLGTRTDQCHFMKIQTARQGRNELPRSLQTEAGLFRRK
jgi:hypothetical protein